MKHIFLLSVFIIYSYSTIAGIDNNELKTNLVFIENKGQIISTDQKPVPFVKYYSKLNNLKLYFSNNEIYYVFQKPIYNKPVNENEDLKIKEIQTNTIKLKLLNSNPNAKIIAEENTQYKENFYYNYCPDGILNVNTFKKITVKDVYKGIDWVLYYDENNNLKYDFNIGVNANPDDIKIALTGKNSPYINDEGKLVIENSLGNISENAPILFQNNKRIDSKWAINNNVITIDYSEVVKSQPFTIDPQVFWSTYAGGGALDRIYSNCSDNANVYYSAGTWNSYFPTQAIDGSSYIQAYAASGDLVIFKFDATNEQLIYTTYYGGSLDDSGDKNIIKVDNNYIYVVGYTASNDFPTLNPGGTTFYEPNSNGWNNGYLLKFAKSNCQRIWATYICENINDNLSSVVTDIVINEGSYIYIVGYTNSPNIPVVGGGSGPQGVSSGPDIYDCFLMKFDYAGAVQWSSYLGGNNMDLNASLNIFNNLVYVMAYTNSTTNNFVQNLAGAYNQNALRGSSDLLLACFNPVTNNIIWGSYFGGDGGETPQGPGMGGEVVSDANNMYVAVGLTDGVTTNLSLVNPGGGSYFDNTANGSSDILILKFDTQNSLVWSTLVGGNSDERIDKICLDNYRFWLSGRTFSSVASFPFLNPGDGSYFNNSVGSGLILQFTKTNNILQWATRFPSLEVRCVYADNNWLWAGGENTSNNLFTVNPGAPAYFDNTYNAGTDGFFAKFDKCVKPLPVINPVAVTICLKDTTTLVATGGLSPTYFWTPSNVSNDTLIVSPSSTTIYNVLCTDYMGCQNNNTVTVTVNPLPQLSITPPTAICLLDSVTLTVSSDLPATYLWSPTNSVDSFTTVSPAIPSQLYTYSVVVTDTANGCVNDTSTTVYVNPLPQLSITQPTAICLLDSVTLTVSSDLPATYLWSPTNSVDSFTTVSPAIPSQLYTYSVVVTDTVNGCVNDTLTAVYVNPLPQLSITPPTAICLLDSVTLTVSSDLPATYLWSPTNSIDSFTTVSPAIPSQLYTYSVVVTDTVNGCVNDTLTAVYVNPLPQLSITPPTAICLLDSVTLTVSSDLPATYLWSPTNSVDSFTNVSPIVPSQLYTYSVVVTDTVNGCVNDTSTTVYVNPLPQLSITPPTAICLLDSVTLTVSSDLPATYLWSPTNSIDSFTTVSPTIPSQLYAYSVVVTDTANGCVNDTSTTVYVNPLPQLSITQPTAICFLDSVTLTVSSDLPSSYLWSPTNSVDSFTVVSPSAPSQLYTYSVVVTDTANGCISDTLTTVYVNPLPQFTITPSTSICYGDSITINATTDIPSDIYWLLPDTVHLSTTTLHPDSTGYTYTFIAYAIDSTNSCKNWDTMTVFIMQKPILTITPSYFMCPYETINVGVLSDMPVSYLWSPNLVVDSAFAFHPLTSDTTYSFTVVGTSAQGCKDTANTFVVVYPDINVTISPQNPTICLNDSITLSGTGAVQYDWYNPLQFSTDSIINVSPDTTTIYTLIGTSIYQCKDTSSTTLIVYPLPTFGITNYKPLCKGESVYPYVVNQFDTTATYLWMPDNLTGTSVTLTPLDTTTYTVLSTDSNNCKYSVSFIVTVDTLPIAQISGISPICYGETAILQATGGTGFLWQPGNTTSSSLTFTPDSASTYSFTMIAQSTICYDTTTFNLVVNPKPVLTITGDTTLIVGQDINLNVSGANIYSWSPIDGLSCIDCTTPYVKPDFTVQYCVVGTNQYSCSDTACVNITVDKECGEVFVPSGFSPNNDNINDVLYAYGKCIKTMEFKIFNRWGEKVFESASPDYGWDGSFRGKPLDTDVFVYFLKVVYFNDVKVETKGNITLMR